MRWLLPECPGPVELAEAYSKDVQVPSGRPFVRVNMLSSLDGAIAFAGRSGPLGGPGDRLVFRVLRSLADVILVGAGTVRAEHYGPVKLPDDLQQQRERRGQSRLPRLAVVSGSAQLDWRSSLFLGPGERPIVVVPARVPASQLRPARQVADVIEAGPGPVDLGAALAALGQLGAGHVLCEGGPQLNASLASAGLVDELCLTLSPKLAGWGGGLARGWLGPNPYGTSPAPGEAYPGASPPPQLLELQLVHLLEEDGFLFLRLRGGRPSPEPPPPQ